MKILLIQGPNMAYLGKRQPEIYGTTTAAELDALLQERAGELGMELEIRYTHAEGEAITWIYECVRAGYDGLVMNPAAMLFAGYALRDCVRAIPIPYVEVHMSNIDTRGFRSVTAEAAVGMVAGFGVGSYLLGLEAIRHHAGIGA